MEFYTTLISKYLLDVYVFSLSDITPDKREIISECNYIFSQECIKIYTDNLFERYSSTDFDVDQFLDENYHQIDPNVIREKLRDVYMKNQVNIRNNNKIVSAGRGSMRTTSNDENGYLVSAGINFERKISDNPFDANKTNSNKENKDVSLNYKRNINFNNKSNNNVNNLINNNNIDLNTRVDNYLIERGLITASYKKTDLGRNTYSANIVNNDYNDNTRLTAKFGLSSSINNNEIVNNIYQVNNKSNEKDIPLRNNFQKDNYETNDKKTVNIQNLPSSPNKTNNVAKSYYKDANKFTLDEDIYKINSPKLDLVSEGNIVESELNMLIINPKKIDKDLELVKSSNAKDNCKNGDLPCEIKKNKSEASTKKNDINDFFGIFDDKNNDTNKNIKYNFNENKVNLVSASNNPTSNPSALNNNLFDFDSFDVKKNTNLNKDLLNDENRHLDSNNDNNKNKNNKIFDINDIFGDQNNNFNNTENTQKRKEVGNLLLNNDNLNNKDKQHKNYENNNNNVERNNFVSNNLLTDENNNDNEYENNDNENIDENEYENNINDNEYENIDNENNNNDNEYENIDNENNNDNEYENIDNEKNNDNEYENNDNIYENNDIPTNIQNNGLLSSRYERDEENMEPQCNPEQDDEFSYEQFREEILKNHNFKRMLHGAQELNPSEELENRAQEWADYLAEKETIESRNLVIEDEEVGESLACVSFGISGEKVTEEWYSQIEKYNFENPRKKNSSSNFTQMIWRNTSYVGFGCRKSLKSGYYFAVAFYYPKGNIEGEYQDNVLPVDPEIIKQLNEMNNDDYNDNRYEEEN